MNMSLKRDSLVTITALAVPVAVFVFAFYLPGRKSSERTNREIAAASRALRDFPLQMAELESLRREIGRREEFLKRASVQIPPESDVHAVLQQVAELADATDVAVTRLEPLPAVQHKSYEALPFQLSGSGSFRAIARFLRGLERQPRLFAVKEFSITQPTRQTGQTVQTDVYFSVYVMREQKAGAADYDASLHTNAADTTIR